MELITVPNDILNSVCDDNSLPTIEEINFAKKLMKEHNGIGIAAPQIGLKKKFFIMGDDVIIHPTIVEESGDIIESVEGCLSIPNKLYVMKRHYNITAVCSLIENGEIVRKTISTEGFGSVVFKHEYDHLFGLLIDRGRLFES